MGGDLRVRTMGASRPKSQKLVLQRFLVRRVPKGFGASQAIELVHLGLDFPFFFGRGPVRLASTGSFKKCAVTKSSMAWCLWPATMVRKSQEGIEIGLSKTKNLSHAWMEHWYQRAPTHNCRNLTKRLRTGKSPEQNPNKTFVFDYCVGAKP